MKNSGSPVPARRTIVLLLVALGGPPAFVALSDAVFGTSPSLTVEVIVHALYCAMAVSVVWRVVHWEHRSLRSIGLRRPDWSTPVTAILLLLSGWYVLPLVMAPFASVGASGVETGVQRLATLPLWFTMILAVTGGAIEEVLYRGFAIERLALLTGRRWLGGALAVVAFALAHIPAWGAGFALTSDLAAGITLTLFYLWRRDLIANMAAHSTGLLLAMRTMGS
jgi:uncharacterized protein